VLVRNEVLGAARDDDRSPSKGRPVLAIVFAELRPGRVAVTSLPPRNLV